VIYIYPIPFNPPSPNKGKGEIVFRRGGGVPGYSSSLNYKKGGNKKEGVTPPLEISEWYWPRKS
jgi:hypothetical protein